MILALCTEWVQDIRDNSVIGKSILRHLRAAWSYFVILVILSLRKVKLSRMAFSLSGVRIDGDDEETERMVK